MHKQSPVRGHKSKGIKVKHVLQICVLVAVCVWLIYQVKHSQEKRREFDAKDEKLLDKPLMSGEMIRIGRKDLPRITEIALGGDKHREEDDDEKEDEEEEIKPEEEENFIKHEEDEAEQEEERGGGDDETDEVELEKKETEYEREVEKVDEDVEENHGEEDEEREELPGKDENFEVEENETDIKEDPIERDLESDDQDHDGDNADTHGAREEQYKADDASSEVAQHVHNIIPKTVNATLGQANGMFGKVDSGQENETKSSNNPASLIKTEVEPSKEMRSSNLTSLTAKNPGLIKTNLSQNAVVEGALGDKDSNLLTKDENPASATRNKTENANINATMASQIRSTDATKPEQVSNENHDLKSGKNEDGNDEVAGDIQHDPIDESDNFTEEERESRVDLETLPDIQTEGQNAEEAMAE